MIKRTETPPSRAYAGPYSAQGRLGRAGLGFAFPPGPIELSTQLKVAFCGGAEL